MRKIGKALPVFVLIIFLPSIDSFSATLKSCTVARSSPYINIYKMSEPLSLTNQLYSSAVVSKTCVSRCANGSPTGPTKASR